MLPDTAARTAARLPPPTVLVTSRPSMRTVSPTDKHTAHASPPSRNNFAAPTGLPAGPLPVAGPVVRAAISDSDPIGMRCTVIGSMPPLTARSYSTSNSGETAASPTRVIPDAAKSRPCARASTSHASPPFATNDPRDVASARYNADSITSPRGNPLRPNGIRPPSGTSAGGSHPIASNPALLSDPECIPNAITSSGRSGHT